MDLAYLERQLERYNKRSCDLIRRVEAQKMEEKMKSSSISVSVTTAPAIPFKPVWACKMATPKEEQMITATIDHGNDEAKRHLRQRARDIKDTKAKDAQKAFGLADDKEPQTANELIARIKDGKFIIRPERGDELSYNNGTDYIRWRDPAKTEDKAGYRLATEALDKQYTATKDAIIVMEPKEGLAAVQAFESATIH